MYIDGIFLIRSVGDINEVFKGFIMINFNVSFESKIKILFMDKIIL